MKPNILFISAGAGSGKTHRITDFLFKELEADRVRPEAVIATTFTKKAATELVERVRRRLAEGGRHDLASSMGQALIGTVNSVCGKLLARHAFEAGLSPALDILEEDAAAVLFSAALEDSLETAEISRMNEMARRLEKENWKSEVKRIVDLARANNTNPSDLPKQAEQNLSELMAFFPGHLEDSPDIELKTATDQALREIGNNEDSTKKTGDYLVLLRKLQRELSEGRFPWSQWVNLSKTEPGKRSVTEAEPVLALASSYDRHPGLHQDIQEWTRMVFTLAARAMETYQEFKTRRGLLDFIDQEHRVLRLLDLPEVAEALEGELDLLMVDEFQDTSPIQLAVFLKLAGLAKKTVWVGDVKQAIYGFRGSDPELMNAVLQGLRDRKETVEILKNSWRSRPQLVHLANDLFAPAFSDFLQEDQVKLTPVREEVETDSALEFWMLQGKNQNLRSRAIATGVLQLFAENRQVVDKQSGQLRPLHYRDVALLSRTNEKAAQYAAALTEVGLPVTLGKAGLMRTPEAVLTLACLRRLADAGDSLASAEIVALHEASRPEEWLENRLEFLHAGGTSERWGLEGEGRHSVLEALEAERAHLNLLSPSEALGRAIWAGEVERAACAWGPTASRGAQRLANLEALRGYAVEYEKVCRQHRSAATVGGLLLWFYELQTAGLDIMGKEDGVDAVQVLTHHGAKGLEWNVVICADLETGIREGLWGASMTSDREGIDLEDPLAERRLHYWVWPFGRQKSGIEVAESIQASQIGDADFKKQTSEAKRLLYVSISRARDLLVLPLSAKSKTFEWLDCLDAPWLEPCEGELAMPSGAKILCHKRILEPTDEVSAPTSEEKAFQWFPPRQTRKERIAASVIPSSIETIPARVGQIISVGKRCSIRGNPEMDLIGTAIHDLIAADLGGGLQIDREERGQALLVRYGLDAHLDASEIMARSQSLRDVLENQFDARSFHPEWPIETVMENGQRLKGWVDLLVDVGAGWVLIDHKSFPGSREECVSRALEHSGQLSAYRRAVEEATSRPVVGQWIYFCVSGVLVQVSFSSGVEGN